MLHSINSVRNLKLYNRQFDPILQRFNLDKGSEDFNQYCKVHNIDQDFLQEILNMFDDSNYFPLKKLMEFKLPVILDYLQKTHHYYLNKRVPEIEQSIIKLQENGHLPLNLICLLQHCFYQFKKDLTSHIAFEENLLIPYAYELNDNKQRSADYTSDFFVETHDKLIETSLSELSKSLRKRYNFFGVGVLCNQLDSFSLDLKIHGEIEDKVLIPKLKKIEKSWV